MDNVVNVKRIMMRNIIYIITAIITFFLFVSCGISKNSSKNGKTPDPHTGSIESYHYELDKMEELLSLLIVYFDNKDKEALKNMFSKKAQSAYNFEKEIDEAMDVLKTGTKYTDTVEGGTVIFKNGISVHFTDDGFIKTIVGQAHVKSTWEVVD